MRPGSVVLCVAIGVTCIAAAQKVSSPAARTQLLVLTDAIPL